MSKFLLGVTTLCLAVPLFLFGPASFMAWQKEQQEQQSLERSRRSNDTLMQLMGLQVATQQYAEDHNGRMPPIQNTAAVKKALQPYLKEASFISISTGKMFQPNPSLSGKMVDKSKGVIWFYDAKRPSVTGNANDGLRAVTYSSGTLSISEESWQTAKKISGIP